MKTYLTKLWKQQKCVHQVKLQQHYLKLADNTGEICNLEKLNMNSLNYLKTSDFNLYLVKTTPIYAKIYVYYFIIFFKL